jgi:ankyrin repeat protein
VKLLLDTGKVDIIMKDAFGVTPMERAYQNGDMYMVEILAKRRDMKAIVKWTGLWRSGK